VTRAPAERVICPVCGREFDLTRKGLVRQHVNKNLTNHLPFAPPCAGAGKTP
jgi:hypothetical protein